MRRGDRPYTYDLPLDEPSNPVPDDYIRHTPLRGPVRWMVVLDVRPVDSRLWANRYRIGTRRIDEHEVERRPGVRIWPSVPYRERETPTMRFNPSHSSSDPTPGATA